MHVAKQHHHRVGEVRHEEDTAGEIPPAKLAAAAGLENGAGAAEGEALEPGKVPRVPAVAAGQRRDPSLRQRGVYRGQDVVQRVLVAKQQPQERPQGDAGNPHEELRAARTLERRGVPSPATPAGFFPSSGIHQPTVDVPGGRRRGTPGE